MTNKHRMKKNYNWAKATLVMGCMLGLGWLATPVMARDMDVRLMDERSEEHTSELQSQHLISYAVFCLKK